MGAGGDPEPAPAGSKLRPVSELRATYLGHAATVLESGGTRLLTDPLLRTSLLGVLRRRHERPQLDTDGLGAVLISHVHRDHLDLPSLRRLGRQTPILVPRGAGVLLTREGFTGVHEVEAGDRLEFGPLRVEVTPAAHGASRRGADHTDALGYLVDDGRARAYFAGDTELFDGMAELVGAGLDIALLPIWGWGPTLGTGHMDPRQAAAALRLLGPRLAVPIHWGTYTPVGAGRIWPWMSHSPAADFVAQARDVAPGTEVVVLAPGESVAA